MRNTPTVPFATSKQVQSLFSEFSCEVTCACALRPRHWDAAELAPHARDRPAGDLVSLLRRAPLALRVVLAGAVRGALKAENGKKNPEICERPLVMGRAGKSRARAGPG